MNLLWNYVGNTAYKTYVTKRFIRVKFEFMFDRLNYKKQNKKYINSRL